jgi:hypothetical protein
MYRVIVIAAFFCFSFFHGSICQAQQAMDKVKIFEKLEEMVLGEEKKTGSLSVESKPSGASVYVENVLKGRTPLTIDEIIPGTLEVRVKLEGYVTEKKELEIEAGESRSVTFLLKHIRLTPGTGVTISADPEGPRLHGTAVTFIAAGLGGTGKYEYRFMKKGPATGGKWVVVRKYSTSTLWTWDTKDDDVGSNKIAVHVRSAGSKAKREARKVMSYVIKRVEAPRKARFFVDTDPADARVRILNIGPPYERGMVLDAGWYQVEVSKKGYETVSKWIEHRPGEDKHITIAMERSQVEQPYDITYCQSGTITIVSESEELTVYSVDFKGIIRSNHENGDFDNCTLHEVGVTRIMHGKRTFYGYCKVMDPEGDYIVKELSDDGTKAIANFLQGTGKWKGITGLGKYEHITQGKPITPGTFQTCVRETGRFQLPK